MFWVVLRELEENSNQRRTHHRNVFNTQHDLKKMKPHRLMQKIVIIQLVDFTCKLIAFKTLI